MAVTSEHGWRFDAAAAPHRLLPSVRARSAVAAVLVVALALASGATLLYLVLQRSLFSGLDSAATGRSAEVAGRLVTSGEGSLDAELKAAERPAQLVQVVNPAGQVVASSSYNAGPGPITGLRPAAGQVTHEEAGPLKLLDDQRPFLAMARGVEFHGETWTVIVASHLEGQRESVRTVLKLLLTGFPVLLAGVAVAVWVLVGRALRPVEEIRRRVAAVDAARIEERVPVPPTRDEIARLAITMNRMLDRLAAAQRAQRQFVADASHELRSPLATLAATLEVADADVTGRAWGELRDVMSIETRRMAALVENLLLLARADDEGLRVDAVDVDLDDLLREEARRLRAAAPALEVGTAIEPVRVSGDHLRLGQMLRNLVDNAGRHASGGVRLGLVRADDDAVLTVDDDGPGIPEPHRRRVFDRFVRLDDSRDRASGGAGLGLPIVREIVVAHGGAVAVVESPDGGCRVIVQIPVDGPAGSRGVEPIRLPVGRPEPALVSSPEHPLGEPERPS